MQPPIVKPTFSGVVAAQTFGQLSGKYYRTRSLSQNLQQIFHPNRQSHSRSINNLSAVGSNLSTMRPQADYNNSRTKLNDSIDEKLDVPQSLPQSPRILIEMANNPFFIPNNFHNLNNQTQMHHSKSLNFPPSSMQQSHPLQTSALQSSPPIYTNAFNYSNNNNNNYNNINNKTNESKLRGYNLGEYRRNKYMRSTSMEVPKFAKPLQKRPSWEERRNSQENYPFNPTRNENRQYQINEVVKENSELLRKYSDSKVPVFNSHPESSPLTLWQSTFKAKLASLFKNKKKYTIMEPSSGKETSGNETYTTMNRCNSAQSLPALISSTNHHKRALKNRKDRSKNKVKKISFERCGDGKLKKLNLNPPLIVGGSYDNLLLINRMSKNKKIAMGTYDTYHGRPLVSQASRLKALCKYRKPSESDDATTLSFEYDSGDLSDTSSLARSSSDVEEISSSSDFTTKSSSNAYQLRSSASVNSMPAIKLQQHEKRSHYTQYPTLNFDSFCINNNNINKNSNTKSFGNRILPNINAAAVPRSNQNPYHQLTSASYPYSRSDYSLTLPMMHNQYPTASAIKPNLVASSTMTSSTNLNMYSAQMIKNFFKLGPAASNEFPLVSFLSFLNLFLSQTHKHTHNIHTLENILFIYD